MKKNQLMDTIIETLKRYPVAFGYLVGSQASGRTTPLSDVDVAVYFDSPINDASDPSDELGADLQGALGRQDVDVINLNKAGIPVIHSIMKEAVPITVKNSEAERRFRRSSIRRYVDFHPTLELIGKRMLSHIRNRAKARGLYDS